MSGSTPDKNGSSPVYDVIVAGSGAAGLVAALAAAVRGAKVLVLEKTGLLGGTTAISGGQVWVPGNTLMRRAGEDDPVERVVRYLDHVTLGQVDTARLETFARRAAYLVDYLEKNTGLRFFRVTRPDYHPGFDGARDGRSVEPLPFDASALGALAMKVRQSPVRVPLTSAEGRHTDSTAIVARRRADDVRTQGAALVAGLVEACARRGVEFRLFARIEDLEIECSRAVGCRWTEGGGVWRGAHARAGVVLASGGFEWSQPLKEAFLSRSGTVPTSPPGNEGDGLTIAMRHGAGLANMSEGWWTAAVQVPGETWDGRTLYRNIVRELALPGSVLVNGAGRRFVNEAMSYNDLGKAFEAFDPIDWAYPNRACWLIFDERFRRIYPIVNVPAGSPAPAWFVSCPDLPSLAGRIGIDPDGLVQTIAEFNEAARNGEDPAFHRGQDPHGRTYGDPANAPNPCLAPLETAPFHAVRVLAGCNGTKGGLLTDADGAVLRFDGSPIGGLYACGNVAASTMGPGYPGTGGSLGPIMTDAIFVGEAMTVQH